MEEVKYIPGDLVMTDGAPIGTKEGVAYVVTASDPNRTLPLKDGTVLKGSVTLDAVTEDDKAYFAETSTWVKHIIPIELTTDILKKSGWKQTKHIVDEDNFEWYEYDGEDIFLPEVRYYPKDDSSEGHFSVFWDDNEIVYAIQYIHQLQHLLFGLGLNSELKV